MEFSHAKTITGTIYLVYVKEAIPCSKNACLGTMYGALCKQLQTWFSCVLYFKNMNLDR